MSAEAGRDPAPGDPVTLDDGMTGKICAVIRDEQCGAIRLLRIRLDQAVAGSSFRTVPITQDLTRWMRA